MSFGLISTQKCQVDGRNSVVSFELMWFSIFMYSKMAHSCSKKMLSYSQRITISFVETYFFFSLSNRFCNSSYIILFRVATDEHFSYMFVTISRRRKDSH